MIRGQWSPVRKRMRKTRVFDDLQAQRTLALITSIKIPPSGGFYSDVTGNGQASCGDRVRDVRAGQWVGWWRFKPIEEAPHFAA